MKGGFRCISFKPGQDWIKTYSFVNSLLKECIEILWNREGFYIPIEPVLCMGIKHAIGCYEENIINMYSRHYGMELNMEDCLPDGEVLQLKPLRVAVFGGGGAPFNYGYGLSELGFDVYYIDASDIRCGMLEYFDAFIMPGGADRSMCGQLSPLGEEGINEIVRFVRRGGMYMGSCAGAYDAALSPKVFSDSFPLQLKLQMINAKVWNDGRSMDWEGLESPGIGVIRVKTCQSEHPILWGVPEEFEITHYNGPIFELADTSIIEGASQAMGLLKWSGLTRDFTPSESFLECGNDDSKTKTLGELAIEDNKLSSVLGYLDRGIVLLFGSHPEFGFNLAMDCIEEPFKLISNALFWQSSRSFRREKNEVFMDEYLHKYKGDVLYKEEEINLLISEVLAHIKENATKLLDAGGSPEWLGREYSLSFFGKGPVEIWNLALEDSLRAIEEIRDICEENSKLAGECIEKCTSIYKEWYGSIFYERDDAWEQDFGYQGMLKLLKMADGFFVKALENYNITLQKSGNPYAYSFESPYHLTAGSYISASGLLVSACLLGRMYRAKLKNHLLPKI